MKKILLIAALMLLLLSSCKEQDESAVSRDEEEVKNESVEISPNEFKIIGNLPDIGDFSGKLQNERFNDEITYDFIPSDEYGKIIPYIGSYRVYETPKEESQDWHTEMGYCTYGFCTQDGKIVMEASDKNTYLNYRETDDGFGYYTINREQLPVEDAPDEWQPSETYVIPQDGSWCLKLPSGSWVTNSGGGYIGISEYPEDGTVRTLLYNYDGELVKTFEGIDNVGVLSNGLMMVSQWVKGGYSAEFVNENGEKVLGPYSSASDFNEHGITAVQDENGAFLINAKGERLTDYYESFYKEFSNDMSHHVFSARHKENQKLSDIYSDKGVFLGTAEGSTYYSFRFPENGDVLYYYTHFDNNDKGYPIYNSERMIWKHIGDGTDFVSKEFGFAPNSYSGTDDCFIHIDKENKTGYLFDANGETIAVIEGVSEIINTSKYGEYAIYSEGEYNYDYDEETGVSTTVDTRKTHIYDSQKKKIVYTVEAGGSAYFADKDKRFILITVFDEEDFFGGISRCWLFDTEKGEIVFEDCNQISLYDVGDKTYICVCTDNSSAVYDEDMKLIRKAYFE